MENVFICVYVINGAREFLPAFMQFLGILLIMGVFDRIAVDTLWVGHTKHESVLKQKI